MSYNIVTTNCPADCRIVKNDGSTAIVIINEQHTLLEAQKELLWGSALPFDQCLVPATGIAGWEMNDLANWLMSNYQSVVFVSPIPGLIKEIASRDAERCILLANDLREKKELPNGKIIFTVSATGWYLA